MATMVVSRTDNMLSAYNTDMDKVHSPASDYSSYAPGNMIATANGSFLYTQTAHTDLSGQVWDTSAEGTQNYQGDEDFQFSYGQITPRGQDQNEAMDEANQWIATEQTAEPMRRSNSRGSSRSHKNRITKSSHKSRPRIVSTMSQDSHMSNFDMTGNAQMDGFLLQDSDANAVSTNMYYPTLPMSLPSDGLSYSPPLLASMAQQHVDPAHMSLTFDGSLTGNSPPHSWGSLSPVESRISSPGAGEDTWSLAQGPMDGSPNPTNNSSPVMDGMSPSLDRQMGMMTTEDANGMLVPDDLFTLPSSFNRRSSADGESTARDHPLYKSAFPKADGLFHCPWEGSSGCNHKPEKLKCNYDKFVDSHLKPYRCKADACENARFSSTACLLRHEREAHAMHGHGDKPYLCTYEGCDRAVHGNGFPRQWNLRDHMRRVHNDNGSSLAHGSSPSAQGSSHSTKGRKRKSKEITESSSSRKHAVRAAQAAEAAAAARAAEQPMHDEWYQHQKALQTYLQEYSTPDAFDYMQGITEAREHMEAMGKISKRLLLSKKSSITQEYRRSFGHHG